MHADALPPNNSTSPEALTYRPTARCLDGRDGRDGSPGPQGRWFIPGGGRAAVPVCLGLSWCTQEELEDLTTVIEGVAPTISACPQIHSTLYHIVLEHKIMPVCMEWNMKYRCEDQVTILMLPVPCA